MANNNYDADILVIGSGPAGYYGAIRAAQLGARTVVLEKGVTGGVCLNIGCIPTKTLLSSIAVLEHVKRSAEFGIMTENCGVDIPTMMARKQGIVKQLTSGVEGLFRKNKIKLIRGMGRITDSHSVSVTTESGVQSITADKILIASGSVPAVIPFPGLEIGDTVWTSNEALEFSAIPKKMLIIGAGAIGLEFGYIFAKLGTEVLVVELLGQILPAADTETANALQKSLEASGIKFMLNATVTHAENTPCGKNVFIKLASGEQTFECDKVLMSVGRRTVTANMGIEEVGINFDKRKIIVNENMQTNISNIYAAGDVVGEPMLAHVGWAEAIVAVEHAMGLPAKMDYKCIPACVYTTPECASVGMTEEQARERYADIRIGRFTFQHNGKAMGIGETEGFVKFICDVKYNQILGIHMIGPHTTDMISEAVLAIKNELTLDEVIATIHPHPTMSEVMPEAAMDVLHRAIHK